MDISCHLEAKSDQLNNIDLIAGDKVIEVTKVIVKERGAEQPVWIHYVGDEGKPWKPCKNMMRVISGVWTANSSLWVGKKIKIYRDPEVIFGKTKPGGVRICQMSGLEQPVSFVLQFRRGVFVNFVVEPLQDEQPKADQKKRAVGDPELNKVELLEAAESAALEGTESLRVWWKNAGGAIQKLLKDELPKLKTIAETANNADDDVDFNEPPLDNRGSQAQDII